MDTGRVSNASERSSRFSPRLDRPGTRPPVGPLQFPAVPRPGQERLQCRRQPFGCRRCLLKGCECWFRPRRPRARYCSDGCRQAARRWQRWRAGQEYRASEQGKERRRAQSRRYRERLRQRHAAMAEVVAAAEQPREGQRLPANSHDLPDFSVRACDRPGCYELFVPTPRSPQQRFCSCSCRQALRRVRQRESRQLARRRRGVRPRSRRWHDSPTAPK